MDTCEGFNWRMFEFLWEHSLKELGSARQSLGSRQSRSIFLPGASQEFRERRAEADATIVEKPLPDFINPNAFANAGIPAHAGTKPLLGMKQQPEQRSRPQLADRFNRLYPKQNAPIGHVSALQNLVFVIPSAEIGLNHTVLGLMQCEGGPTVRRGVESLDLIGIVRKQLPKRAPVITVLLLNETGDPRRHRDDPMLSHQAN